MSATAYTKESLQTAYARSGNLRAACAETGAPPYIAYIWLRKAGILAASDKATFGTRPQRQGASAEREFQRLVPLAMPANQHLQGNCPGFDFDVGGVLVDVKYSAVRRSNGRWGFQFAKNKPLAPDFYAAFFATDQSGDLTKGYRLFLVPHYLFDGRDGVSLRPDDATSELCFFEIEPDRLAETLAEGVGE